MRVCIRIGVVSCTFDVRRIRISLIIRVIRSRYINIIISTRIITRHITRILTHCLLNSRTDTRVRMRRSPTRCIRHTCIISMIIRIRCRTSSVTFTRTRSLVHNRNYTSS